MTAPAGGLRARFGDIEEALRGLELLADWFDPGVAGSISASLADWKELLDEPSIGYMDKWFVPDDHVTAAQAATARMWKHLLFGPGLPIGYEKRQLEFALMASIVRPALKWGVPVLFLAAFAFLALRFLSGTGSVESRVAVAILGLAGLVASAVSPLGRKAKEFWQKHYGQLAEATVTSSLIRECLAAPVRGMRAEARDQEARARRRAFEQERQERAGSAGKLRGPRRAEPPAPAAAAGDGHPEGPDAAGRPGTGDPGHDGAPGRGHEELRLVREPRR